LLNEFIEPGLRVANAFLAQPVKRWAGALGSHAPKGGLAQPQISARIGFAQNIHLKNSFGFHPKKTPTKKTENSMRFFMVLPFRLRAFFLALGAFAVAWCSPTLL
jgi:hypothetical protein